MLLQTGDVLLYRLCKGVEIAYQLFGGQEILYRGFREGFLAFFELSRAFFELQKLGDGRLYAVLICAGSQLYFRFGEDRHQLDGERLVGISCRGGGFGHGHAASGGHEQSGRKCVV